jgi:hypothetical protein
MFSDSLMQSWEMSWAALEERRQSGTQFWEINW